MSRAPATVGDRAWLALTVALAALACALHGQPSALWDWQPALAWREPWRWWTAAGVHWSALHLGLNLVGCALVGLLGWRAQMSPADALVWALAWPLTQLGLLAQPSLAHYGGLSGVLHAGVAVVAWHLLSQRRWLGALLALGLLLKLLSEQPWSTPTREIAGWDFALAPLGHASGVTSAWLLLSLRALWRRTQHMS